MSTPRKQLGGLGKEAASRPIDLDAPVQWSCSAKGWNCCVDKGIPVYPYDLIRLRHATGRSAEDLINSGTVTFSWHPFGGALTGMLVRRPYGQGHERCVFLEEVTPADLRARAEADPEAFRALPDFVRKAADSNSDYRVAGLCGVHTGRPMACRSLPFMRQRTFVLGAAVEVSVNQVHYCGSCAFGNVTTTPREVLLRQGVEHDWRAADAFQEVAAYLRSLGLATLRTPGYRALPITDAHRAQLWASLYVAEANLDVSTRWGDSWRDRDDPDRDLAIFRTLVEHTLRAAERLVDASVIERDALGVESERGLIQRPDLDALLDPARPLLPPAPEAARLSA